MAHRSSGTSATPAPAPAPAPCAMTTTRRAPRDLHQGCMYSLCHRNEPISQTTSSHKFDSPSPCRCFSAVQLRHQPGPGGGVAHHCTSDRGRGQCVSLANQVVGRACSQWMQKGYGYARGAERSHASQPPAARPPTCISLHQHRRNDGAGGTVLAQPASFQDSAGRGSCGDCARAGRLLGTCRGGHRGIQSTTATCKRCQPPRGRRRRSLTEGAGGAVCVWYADGIHALGAQVVADGCLKRRQPNQSDERHRWRAQLHGVGVHASPQT